MEFHVLRTVDTHLAPRALGLEGPESARYASIARQFYETMQVNLSFRQHKIYITLCPVHCYCYMLCVLYVFH